MSSRYEERPKTNAQKFKESSSGKISFPTKMSHTRFFTNSNTLLFVSLTKTQLQKSSLVVYLTERCEKHCDLLTETCKNIFYTLSRLAQIGNFTLYCVDCDIQRKKDSLIWFTELCRKLRVLLPKSFASLFFLQASQWTLQTMGIFMCLLPS